MPLPVPMPVGDSDIRRQIVLEQDAVLERLASHLEELALYLRSHGLDYVAEQIERVG